MVARWCIKRAYIIFKTSQEASALKKLLNGTPDSFYNYIIVHVSTLSVSSLTANFEDAILAVPDVCSCLQQQTLAPETLRSKDNELLSIMMVTTTSLVPTPLSEKGCGHETRPHTTTRFSLVPTPLPEGVWAETKQDSEE